MDNFIESFNSSNPNFTFQGNKENELIEETGFKLKKFNRKRLPKNKTFAKRKRTENPSLSKAVSFDSIASRFPVIDTENDVKNSLFVDSCYHPVTNYLTPRPKYLLFSPDRSREILARKETVNRFIKSASYDCVMHLSDEELESSVCSVEETNWVTDKSVHTGGETEEVVERLVDNVEETGDIIAKSADSGEEMGQINERLVDNVEETEEIIGESADSGEEMGEVSDRLVENVEEKDEIIGEFDKDEEFEDENGWSLKLLLKWLVVMIVLILTTLTISSVDLPTPPAPFREAIRGCMDLFSKTQSGAGYKVSEVFKAVSVRNYDHEEWDKKDLVVNGDVLSDMRHEQIEDVCADEPESNEDGSEKVENEEIDVDPDDIWNKKGSVQFQESILSRAFFPRYYEKPEGNKYTEVAENEMGISGKLQLIDSNQKDIEEDVDEKEDDNNNGLIDNEIEDIKTVPFDPFIKAFIGISLLIFTSSSVLYYSMQTEISSLIETPKNEASYGSSSVTSFDQSTGDSQSHGSFTIEKTIVKKQKSKIPESTISKVRRSSRIQNRYVTPSP